MLVLLFMIFAGVIEERTNYTYNHTSSGYPLVIWGASKICLRALSMLGELEILHYLQDIAAREG